MSSVALSEAKPSNALPFDVPTANRKAGGENVAPRQTAENETALAKAIETLAEQMERNGQKSWTDKWGGTTITCVVFLLTMGMSSMNWGRDTERDLKIQNAVLEQRLTQTEKDFTEFRRISERDSKLADERFRQLSIALESRGFRLPTK